MCIFLVFLLKIICESIYCRDAALANHSFLPILRLVFFIFRNNLDAFIALTKQSYGVSIKKTIFAFPTYKQLFRHLFIFESNRHP